jgi:aromatic ring-opening dioxygenase LigB subunit
LPAPEREVIIFAAIAPHGNPVYTDPEGATRRGMEKLKGRFEAARPEAVILVTPHGMLVDGQFGVVRSAHLAEHVSQFTIPGYVYEGPGLPPLGDECVRALQSEGLPAAGLTFGASLAEASVMPIDWGAAIPLWFMRAPAVVVTPCRALSNDEHVRAGAALARASGERRVAFVASADHGHGHGTDGPYGFSEHSKPYDDAIVDLVQRNALGELVGWDAQRAIDAKADSFWQLLMLHGALGDDYEAELISYEAPTYFGMLTASFVPR